MLSFPFLLMVSLAAGFVGAMSGMGGGVVLIPVLTFVGLDIKRAIAASIVSVIASSSGAASAYVRDGITNVKVGMFLEIFTMVGAWTGALITLSINERTLYILFGAILFVCWGALWIRQNRPHRSSVQDRFSRWLELEGHYFDKATGEEVSYKAIRAYWGGPLMFLAGITSGLLGIGAGAVKVLIHDLVMELPPKVSTTTSNLIIGVTALAGTSVYLSKRLIDPLIAGPVILGVVAGALAGTRVLVHLKNETVRKFFLLVLAVLGAEMIVRGWRGA